MTHQLQEPAYRSQEPSPSAGGWLTAVLRPAGTLDGAAAAAFGRSLRAVSATADMVVVDLDAARIPDVAAFVDTLRASAERLARPGGCLLLVNPPRALERAVRAAGVPAATLAAELVPGSAQPASGSPASRSSTRRTTAWSSSPRPLQRAAP
jgi:anti-anti-sigma regulatory factor